MYSPFGYFPSSTTPPSFLQIPATENAAFLDQVAKFGSAELSFPTFQQNFTNDNNKLLTKNSTFECA